MDIPRDKIFPSSAGQCDSCGGHGCRHCDRRGWLKAGSPGIRRCLRPGCTEAIAPQSVAVYCSADCAIHDLS